MAAPGYRPLHSIVPVRPRPRPLAVLRGAVLAGAVAAVFVGCGDGGTEVADQRADQASRAALDAGLEADVGDFLGLLARGRLATYEVTYPGIEEGDEIVVRNRPPDRRVDVVVDGEVTESRLVVDGSSYRCVPEDVGQALSCERTDAFVEPPGIFTDRSLAALVESLRERRDDFSFAVERTPVAGVEGTCLVTRIRSGRARSGLGDGGSICASTEGAILRIDQAGEVLEASDYRADVDPDAFILPDR